MFFYVNYSLFTRKNINFAIVINLNRHIEILLLNNDCVIIPDFGCFMAHHVEAKYDDKNQIFLPPLRTIGFNPQLKMNDSLLAQSYVEAYDISYPEALIRIEDEVNELKQRLEIEGNFTLTDIGTLTLTEDGKYNFEPCEAGTLTPSLYGLSNFDFPMLQEVETTQDITNYKEVMISKDAIPSNNTTSRTLNSILNEEQEDKTKERTISIRVSVLRNLAAACIVLIASLFFATPLGNYQSSKVNQSSIDTGILYHILPKDISSNIPLKLNTNKTANSKKVNIELSSLNNNSKTSVPTSEYSIVVASHTTTQNAEAYVNILRKQGYVSARVLTNQGATKVVLGHYRNEKEALKALNTLNNEEEFAGGWVIKINKQI